MHMLETFNRCTDVVPKAYFFVFLGPSNHVGLRNNIFRLHSNWNYSIQCIYNLHNHVVIDNRDYLKVLMLIGWVRIEKKIKEYFE